MGASNLPSNLTNGFAVRRLMAIRWADRSLGQTRTLNFGIFGTVFFGRTPPKRDWVNLVGDDIAFERDAGEVRVWRFSDGDALGVYFFNVEPDLPRYAEFSSFVATTREAVAASGAVLVECKLITLEHVPAIRQIMKAPQKPSGMTYLGAFTLPFASFSYVLKEQCEERGMTGLREAVLLDEALQNKTVTINPDSSTPINGDWQPDSEKFDDRFHTHPLSRVRRHLRCIESYVKLDKAIHEHPRFPLPAADA